MTSMALIMAFWWWRKQYRAIREADRMKDLCRVYISSVDNDCAADTQTILHV